MMTAKYLFALLFVVSLASATSYNIATCTDLQNIKNDKAGTYTQTGNIDCTASSGWNGGLGFEPIGTGSGDVPSGQFTGTLNGAGYNITNLYIHRSTGYLGIFGSINGATITDVHLENASVWGTGGIALGTLVGHMVGSTVNLCSSSGTLNGNYGAPDMGGLIGIAYGGANNIVSSYSSVTVVGGSNRAGGLIGYTANTDHIMNCHATGSVTGQWYVGGLAGQTAHVVNNSYATGAVVANGGSYVGGLVGGPVYNHDPNWAYNDYSTGSVSGSSSAKGGLIGAASSSCSPFPCAFVNSYWDKQTSGQSTSVYGVGFNTIDMVYNYVPSSTKPPNNATGPYYTWDFSSPVWYHDVATLNAGYPVLASEAGSTASTLSVAEAAGLFTKYEPHTISASYDST